MKARDTARVVWVKITKMPTKIKNVANALNAYETSFDCTQISHVKQKSPALALYEVSKRLMDENIDFRTRGER